MKRLILILSMISVSAQAKDMYVQPPLTEFVTCNIGIEIWLNGKPNHLNINGIKGRLVDDNHDFWTVDFSSSLPKQYKYTEGPTLRVNGNSCLYVNPPKWVTK